MPKVPMPDATTNARANARAKACSGFARANASAMQVHDSPALLSQATVAKLPRLLCLPELLSIPLQTALPSPLSLLSLFRSCVYSHRSTMGCGDVMMLSLCTIFTLRFTRTNTTLSSFSPCCHGWVFKTKTTHKSLSYSLTFLQLCCTSSLCHQGTREVL